MCTRRRAYCRGLSESPSTFAVMLVWNDGRHRDTEAARSWLAQINWFVAAPNPNLHPLISRVGKTQRREAEPPERRDHLFMSQSAEMDLLREEGEQEKTRQIIADQNKHLTDWRGEKGRKTKNATPSECPWPFPAHLERLNFNHPLLFTAFRYMTLLRNRCEYSRWLSTLVLRNVLTNNNMLARRLWVLTGYDWQSNKTASEMDN